MSKQNIPGPGTVFVRAVRAQWRLNCVREGKVLSQANEDALRDIMAQLQAGHDTHSEALRLLTAFIDENGDGTNPPPDDEDGNGDDEAEEEAEDETGADKDGEDKDDARPPRKASTTKARPGQKRAAGSAPLSGEAQRALEFYRSRKADLIDSALRALATSLGGSLSAESLTTYRRMLERSSIGQITRFRDDWTRAANGDGVRAANRAAATRQHRSALENAAAAARGPFTFGRVSDPETPDVALYRSGAGSAATPQPASQDASLYHVRGAGRSKGRRTP